MGTANTAKAEKRIPPGLKPWKPGQSGNPSGRPKKDRALTAALEVELDKKVGRKTKRQLVAAKVVSLALDGDMTAAKFLADRTEGLPVQPYRFDDDDLGHQARALAEEAGVPIDQVEPMLRTNLHLVK